MTVKRYLSDPATTSGTATITEVFAADRPIVRVAETWFHPQGGGQKADRGKIGPMVVTHVAHNAGDVDHFVSEVSSVRVGDQLVFQIDPDWRRLNAAYHTSGHLIASLVEARFPALRATAGHQWPGEARVEFDGRFGETSEIRSALEEDIQRSLEMSLPIQIIGDPYLDRAIQIGPYTPIPCGGTHVSSLSEISKIIVESVKKKSGRLRVSYTVIP
jgi:alanyl-tRNA synthetase